MGRTARIRGAALLAAVALVLPGLGALLVTGATPAAAQGDPIQTVPGTGLLFGIACPTATTCEATGGEVFAFGSATITPGGSVVPITDGVPGTPIPTPDAHLLLLDVACVSASACVAAGVQQDPATQVPQGVAVPIVNGVPGPAQVIADTEWLYGMSCSSSTMCTAVGVGASTDEGAVVTIDPATGLALGPTVQVPAVLFSVSCPTTSVCEAVGVASGTGAAVAITPATSPAVAPVQSLAVASELIGVSCFSATSCEGVGIVVSATGSFVGATVVLSPGGAPGTVESVPSATELFGVSCPTNTACEAVGITANGVLSTVGGVAVSIGEGVPGVAQVFPDLAIFYRVACTAVITCETTGTELDFTNDTEVGTVVGLASVGVAGSQTYGSTTPTFATTTNPPTGTTFSGTLSCTSVNGGAATIDATLPAGTYTLDGGSCSGVSIDTNATASYEPLFGDGTFTVTQASTTTTLTSAPNPSAPGQAVTLTATVTGADGGGSVTFSDNGNPISGCPAVSLTAGKATCTTTAINVGDSLVATYSGDNNVTSSFSAPPLTQLQSVAVTVTGSQTVGGSPAFSTSQSLPAGISLSGSVACTTVNGGTAISTSLPVASYTIDGTSCSGLSLTGTGSSNYDLSLTGGMFTVNPASVAVTVSGSQTFGGSPTFSTSQSLPAGISLSGSVACTTVNGGTAISTSLPVASYTIDGTSCSGLSLSGTGASNLVIAYAGGTFTVSPVPVPVTLTGSQTYGATPTFTAAPTSGALPQGVTLEGTPACTTVDGGTSISPTLSAGGAYTLDSANCTGLSLGGAAAADYVVAYSGGTFTVTKATPTITWGPPSGIVYGTALSATQLDASATATVAGQVVAVAGSFGYSPTAGDVLRSGPHTLSTTFTPADTVDYNTAIATVALTVTPAPLTVTANDATRPFGALNPTFGASYQGLVNNDSPASLAGTLMFTTKATPASPPGTYPIVASGLSSPDYTITYFDGTLTVTQAPTTTTVTVSPAMPTLGGLVTFTATVAAAQANGSGINPTGTVAFYVDGATTAAATVHLAADGTAAFQVTLPGGTTTVSAAYRGDPNFLGSSTATPATATIACAQTITGQHTGAIIASKGLTCIVNAKLSGSVTVEAGASLDVENSTLDGAIVANGATSIRICGDTTGSTGSINVAGSTGFVVVGDPGEDRCAPNVVGGALNLLNNTGGLVAVDNTITGSLNASGNRGAGPFPDQTTPDVTGNHR